MRAILYARFSPRPNAAECESCESQLNDLRAYCTRLGWEIAGEYQDKALSGGNDWQDRPGMFDAAQACKRGNVFVVLAFDRLFRDTEKALVFKSLLEAKGVTIRSITEEVACDGSPIANMVRTIFLAVAEYQREMIRARTRAKMLEHQRNGRRMSLRTPYGTMNDPCDPKRLVPCREEQAAIVVICDLQSRGLGLREIARKLEELRIPRRGKEKWTHGLVRSILTRLSRDTAA